MGTTKRARRKAKQMKRRQRRHEESGADDVASAAGPTLSLPTPALARAALAELVRRWPAGDGRSTMLIEALAAPGSERAIISTAPGMFADSVAQARVRNWRRADVARVATKAKYLEPGALSIVEAFDSPGSWRLVLPPAPPARKQAIRDVVAALAFLLDLQVLPELADSSRDVDPDQMRMLEKVRALLAKAESTEFDEEAEALTAKAQELMTRYAIDAAFVEESRGATSEVGTLRIGIDDPYASAKAVLLGNIAGENRCRAIWIDRSGLSIVFGTDSDLRTVEVLYTSLLLQAVAAMQRAGSRVDAFGRSRTRSFRHAFLVAFGGRIRERLREANQVAERHAVADLGGAFLPVLASRADAAERARDEAFPHTRAIGVSLSNGDGYAAGRAAADVATIHRGAPLPSFSQ